MSKVFTLFIAITLVMLLSGGCSNQTANIVEVKQEPSTMEKTNETTTNQMTGGNVMQSYQEFFVKNPNGVMGTVDDGEARTRTFQILWIEDSKLYFCTGNHKPVYEQMKLNPKVSFTALNAETMESVSICGTAVFVDDLDGKKRALDENPGTKAIYQTPDNPTFELLYVEVSDVSSFIFSNGDKK